MLLRRTNLEGKDGRTYIMREEVRNTQNIEAEILGNPAQKKPHVIFSYKF
jgi:hypothetical protein